MGFSLYWTWEKPLADAEKFVAWSSDVQYLLAYLTASEHHNSIPAIFSFDKQWIAEMKEDGTPSLREIDTPHREANWLIICGPEGTGEPIFTPTQVAFNGNISTENAGEEFRLSLADLEKAPFWQACKTGWSPYATLAICALVRFIHYFPETTIFNDEDTEPVIRAVAICEQVFEENRSPQL